MAQPNPINVSPSTTFVQVNPLQSPYTPVILQNVSFPGQVVTVLDATSSFGALTTPIVLSTQTLSFQDGSISTLINQPQGFVTVQSLPTNQWAFLNSYPFRNQTVSAGVYNLTTSTLFTALLSTGFDSINQLTVENLTVTGNFVQSQGITLNTNLSSLGTVQLVSSLSIWGPTYMSSALSTLSSVSLASSLQVGRDTFIRNSLQILSTFTISGSLVALGSFSTGILDIQGGLRGTSLEVQQSSYTTLIAGNIYIPKNLSTLSSIFIGSNVQANTMAISTSASFLSSAVFYQDVVVPNQITVTRDVSTVGLVGIADRLTVGYETTVSSSIYVGNIYIPALLTNEQLLITSTLTTNVIQIAGDFTGDRGLATLSSLTVGSSLGLEVLLSKSTFVGSNVTANRTFDVQGSMLLLNSSFTVQQSISTLSHTTIGKDFDARSNLSVLQTLTTSSFLSTAGIVTVGASTFLSSTPNTYVSVIGDVYSLGNLTVGETLTISSYSLPSSLVASNMKTGQITIGDSGIFKDSYLQKVVASSVTVGYLPTSVYPFDLSGSVQLSTPVLLSSPLVSSQLYSIVPGFSTSYLIVQGGMGIQEEPIPGNFVVKPLAYFLTNPVQVLSTLSTHTVFAQNSITGKLVGDGSLLTNLPYPPNLSTFEIFTNGYPGVESINSTTGVLTVSSMVLSSYQLQGTLFEFSTLNLAGVSFEVDPGSFNPAQSSNRFTGNTVLNVLNLNNTINFRGVSQGSNNRVAINEVMLINQGGGPFSGALGVYSTLGVKTIGSEMFIPVDTYRANKIIASTVIGYGGSNLTTSLYATTGTVEISSGAISLESSPFFIGEQETYDPKFNSIQPFQSTLQFNSTLFVRRDTGRVGIRTKPNYELDAQTVLTNTVFNVQVSTLVNSRISMNVLPSTQFYAFVQSTSTYASLLTSPNLSTWNNGYDYFQTNSTYEYNSFFTAGYITSKTLKSPQNDTAKSNLTIQALLGTNNTDANAFTGGKIGFLSINAGKTQVYEAQTYYVFPKTFRGMATDGNTFVATGTNNDANGYFLWKNSIGDSLDYFEPVNTNIFEKYNGRSNGGYDIVYGGTAAPVWIVVGAGYDSNASAVASAYRSFDLSLWSSCTTGLDELRAIITFQLPETGSNVFMATGGLYDSGKVLNGSVVTSVDQGVTWQQASPAPFFDGPGLGLATDGNQVVVACEQAGKPKLYYSYITPTNTYSWYPCTGATFQTRANTVVWNGSFWLAGGDFGFLQSFDGKDWFTPASNITTEVFKLGYTSNAIPSITVGDSNTQTLMYLQDSPTLSIENRVIYPSISFYPSSILNLNNGCVLDSQTNIVAPGYFTSLQPSYLSSYTSTIYALTAYVSTTVSTNKLQVGLYKLGLQLV